MRRRKLFTTNHYNFNRRILVVTGVLFSLFLVLVCRLAYIQLWQHEALAASVRNQSLRLVDQYQYDRGTIFDCQNRAFTNIYSAAAVAFPAMVKKPAATAQALASVTELSATAIFNKIAVKKLAKPPAVLASDLTDQAAKAINNLQLPGIFVLPLYSRYSSQALAVHTIGYVNQSPPYDGLTGIEKQYDQYLQQKNGAKIGIMVDEKGHLIDDIGFRLIENPPAKPNQTTGCDVYLTLDQDFQQIAERALGNTEGAAVVMAIANGDLKALASSSKYDPYMLSAPASKDGYINKCFALYYPASVYKLVLAAAALESDIVIPNAFTCTGSLEMANGRIIKCWHEAGHGAENLSQALGNSCNPYFVNLGLMLGGDTIKAYSYLFGLRQQEIIGYKLAGATNIDFNSAVAGDVANASIGENGVRLSPVMVAQIVATIANGGYQVTPRLVTAVKTALGQKVLDLPAAPPKRVIEPQTAQVLQQMMAAAVDYGTAQPAQSQYFGSGGKTGTSQYYGVWYAGFFPTEKPQYAVVVYAQNGQSGGHDAAPIFKEIAENIANLEGLMP